MSAVLQNASENANISNWNADDGYLADEFNKSYPRRTSNTSPVGVLNVNLDYIKKATEFKCSNITAAFRIFLHTPGEIPDYQHPSQIYASDVTSISITPELTTSYGLRSWPPDKRRCFFNFERQLRFYKIYSQRNCEEECLSNYTKSHCGCVLFHMTSINWAINT